MPSPRRQAPLFHPRALRDRLAAHRFPTDLADRHALLLPWIASLRAGKIDEAKEVSLHGEFLGSVFGGVLGYRRTAETGAEGWDLAAEKTMGGGGKSADGALGFFTKGGSGRVLAPIELKGARHSLDNALGRALTPVQQAWDYANHSPGCRWIIVSNYRETRIYSTARTPDVYESFLLEDLESFERFRAFYFVFARENLLADAPDGRSPTDELLAASAKVEAEITKELYEEYRQLRKDLYTQLSRAHSNLPALDVLGYAQTILDRILFIAFAEDRGLLPPDTIAEACDFRHKYKPTPLWQNFQAVFRWIDEGSPEHQFPAYNGGLFRYASDIEELDVSDAMCKEFKKLARYDFREEVSVDVLGHIFEQSISDLEEMRAEASQVAPAPAEKVSKRRKEGIFYTPAYITRYIVDQTLGRTLRERFEAIYDAHKPDDRKKEKDKDQAWIAVWEAYREAIKNVRVLDPACGSGAFLVAAYEALAREYDRVNAALAALRKGQVELLDLNKTVLNNNLFGVDLNPESVEITKLSLWLKTAERGRQLTYLDSNIKWGNSIVSDPALCVQAFDWRTGQHAKPFLDPSTAPEAAAIDARWREGFDVVIGNPPYVRQELLTAIKSHLETHYETYHGMGDIYVYFFERALRELRVGGRLGFIVTNKWLRSGYAELLRKLLATRTKLETLVDFGHAPIFPDADVFPCIVTLQKPTEHDSPLGDNLINITAFPRDQLKRISIPEYVAANRYHVPQGRLGANSWGLEPPAVDSLFAKIARDRVPLSEFSGAKPYRGVVTGFNEAFVIDDRQRNQLISQDARSGDVLKKLLRGQDVTRWAPEWPGKWLIFTGRGLNIDDYPAIKDHLSKSRAALEPKPSGWKGDDWPGRKAGSYKWYETQDPVDYWKIFLQPKIIYQEIQFHAAYALDREGLFVNNKVFVLPTDSPWLLAVLNSPLLWWHNWRYLPHMKDETLTPVGAQMETLPIAPPSAAAQDRAAQIVPRLIQVTKQNSDTRLAVIDSLRMQFDVETPGQKLADFASLDPDSFVKEVLARRPKSAGKLRASTLKDLRQIYLDEAPSVQERRHEAATLERHLSDLVNEAYGLTPEEVELMWNTAPPRMPVER